MSGVKLIVGLGNPGIEYQFTPHNAGFLAVDRIAEDCGVMVTNRRGRALTAKAKLAGQEVLLAKPETFMNLSGLSVAALIQELEISPEDVIVLYDELALPLGTIRIRERGSANGHNGVKSISGVLGTEEWLRIRIGVGRQRKDWQRWRMEERLRRAARTICCRRCASRSLRCWMKCSTERGLLSRWC